MKSEKALYHVSCWLYYLDALQSPEIARTLSPTPAIAAPTHPSKERQVTIVPAISIPMKMDRKACLNFRPKRTAASEPVQAPVTGRGIATNSVRPIRSYLSITCPRRLVRSKSQWSPLLKTSILLSSLERAWRNNRIKGTGTRLPIIASRKA